MFLLSKSPVSRIASKEGVAALYSGLVPGLQRQMAFSAIRIGRQQYENIQHTYYLSLHPYLLGLYDSVKEELRSTLGVSCSDTGAMLGVRVNI